LENPGAARRVFRVSGLIAARYAQEMGQAARINTVLWALGQGSDGGVRCCLIAALFQGPKMCAARAVGGGAVVCQMLGHNILPQVLKV
jgi:hypothetical protein